MTSNGKSRMVIGSCLCAGVFLVGVLAASAHAYIPVDDDDQWTASLNGRWRFRLKGPTDSFCESDFDDSSWEPVSVPGNWEIEGFEQPRYGTPDEGTGLYRRSFRIGEAWKKRRTFIRFEGVLYGFEFWVNGAAAGKFNSAFNRSEFDISELVRFDKPNTIAVRVDRRSRGWDFDTYDAWALSGIYRDVTLFSAPPTRIEDFAVTSSVKPDHSSATVECELLVTSDSTASARLRVALVDPAGKKEIFQDRRMHLSKGLEKTKFSFRIDEPELWNAETPRLYELDVRLRAEDGPSHGFKRRIGIRQVTIDGDVLKLNHRPIKMRGVNHHDIHPDVGRALRLTHYSQDVELMKRANINAVRTSHYPPHPMFLSLCDESGLYVIDEVPFGKGEHHLEDPSWLPDLLARAEATVARDRNHPSVIVWSIGNENDVTDNVVRTVERVRRLDPTRPRVLPGAGGGSYQTALPDCIDMMAPHYPYAHPAPERGRWGLSEAAVSPEVTRPILCTEYNHSLGSAYEGLRDHWELMFKCDRLAGGCIWHFQDQGLKRAIGDRVPVTDTKTRLDIDDGALSADTWLDGETILDSRGGSGTDGIVYADRVPQVDYWTTRKVYSPVKIPISEARISPGRRRLEIPVENRYDFTDLDKVRGKWRLLRDGREIGSGAVSLSCPPHGASSTTVDLSVGGDLDRREYLLELTFVDFDNRPIDEHSVRLLPTDGRTDFARRLTDLPRGPLQRTESADVTTYSTRGYRFEVNTGTGTVAIRTPDVQQPVMTGPILRVGRTPAMAEYRNYPRYDVKFWEPALLTELKLRHCAVGALNEGAATVDLELEFLRPRSPEQSVVADLRWTLSCEGWIDLDYELTPHNVNGNFLELGLAFRLPARANELSWLGDGPFNSYPGQTDAARRGLWHVRPLPMTDPNGRYYDGNRANVDVAAVTDDTGRGLGMLMDRATISLEAHDRGMVFSHLLCVAGKGNKTGGMMTLLPVQADEVTSANGRLRIIVLGPDNRPELFARLFAGRGGSVPAR